MCRLFTVTIYRLFTVISESIVCKSLLLTISYHDERLIGSPSFRSKVMFYSLDSWVHYWQARDRNRKNNLSIIKKRTFNVIKSLFARTAKIGRLARYDRYVRLQSYIMQIVDYIVCGLDFHRIVRTFLYVTKGTSSCLTGTALRHRDFCKITIYYYFFVLFFLLYHTRTTIAS